MYKIKKGFWGKAATRLGGAADQIALFDNAAFEKKTGELIGRSARAESRKKAAV
jgi:hypothetical protein